MQSRNGASVHRPEASQMEPGPFPRMIPLSFSMVCNAHCIMCPYENEPSIPEAYSDQQYMPEALFKTIADQAGEHGAWLRLSGREPTLHPEIVPLVEYARQRGCHVGLITNGSRMTVPLAFSLMAAQIDSIEFSVDAANSQDYSRIRQGLDFMNLVENVRGTVDARNSLGASTRILASIIDMGEIDADQASSFWETIVDAVQVRRHLTWGLMAPRGNAGTPEYMDDKSACPFAFQRLNIDSHGDISLCGYDVGFKTVVGNVYRDPISRVWLGPEMQRVRQCMIGGQWDEIPLCRDCEDRKWRSWGYNIWKLYQSTTRPSSTT